MKLSTFTEDPFELYQGGVSARIKHKQFYSGGRYNHSGLGPVAIMIVLTFVICTQAFSQLLFDSSGWTVFTPGSDTRLIYVSSSSGNDSTAQPYLPTDPAIGSDPFNPTGTIKPYKTIAAALLQMREFYPDWMLLKRGDVWFESLGINLENKSGKSATEPSLFSAYGTGDRPLLKIGAAHGFQIYNTSPRMNVTTDNIAFAHIEFYSHTRDPHSVDFDSTSNGAQGGKASMFILKSGSNILVEGCKFSYSTGNSVGRHPAATNVLDNFKFRRNVVDHCYRNTSGHSHCQGLFGGHNVDNMLIEENVFWHNGWSEDVPGAPATKFNRNMYLASDEKNLVVRGNISVESASEGVQQRSGGICEDNLFLKNSAAILFGNSESAWPNETIKGFVRNNVCLDARDIDSVNVRGGGIMIQHADSVDVYHNIIAHQKSGTANIRAFSIFYNYRNINLHQNIVYDWTGKAVSGKTLFIADTVRGTVRITENIFEQISSNGSLIQYLNGTPDSTFFKYSGNKYYSNAGSSSWFYPGGDYANWLLQSHETGSDTGSINFIDPNRDITTYMNLLGETPSLDAFMEEAIQQRKGYWRDEYTAYNVNCYIREGFQTPLAYNTSPDTITICAGDSAAMSVSGLNTNSYSLSLNGGVPTTDTSFVVSPTITTNYQIEITDSAQLWKTCEPMVHNFLVIVNNCTGVSEVKSSPGFVIYPNPAGDVLCVSQVGEGMAVVITDILGKMQSFNMATSALEQRINLSGFSPGLYMISLFNENKVVANYRFVKQ